MANANNQRCDRLPMPSFKLVQPNTFWSVPVARLFQRIERAGIHLEYLNTNVPEQEKESGKAVSGLCSIPKMSTFAIGFIINAAVRQMQPDHAYVNIGVWHGYTLLSGMLNNADRRCIGIDNFSQFGGPRERFLKNFAELRSPNHEFYELDYRTYFESIHKEPIGLYYYDGDHSYENQLQGLKIAEPFFSEDCCILVDDTNEPEPREATMDFVRRSRDKYRVLLDQQTYCNGHPTFWNGLLILKREAVR